MAETRQRRAARRHAERLLRAAGEPIELSRRGERLKAEVAIPARREAIDRGRGEGPSRSSSAEMDFLILAEDYAERGKPTEPKRKDRIVWEDATGRRLEYDVMPATNERAFDTADQHGVLLRVHTKLNRKAKTT